jgi:hypothetical protein
VARGKSRLTNPSVALFVARDGSNWSEDPARQGVGSARQTSALQVLQVRRNEGLMSAQSTAISLDAKQAIWWILVTIQPLIVEVDGVQTKGTWGDQTLPVAPGSHRISVSWKFYWVLPVQRATLDVTVDPGAVVSLRYKVRWLIFLPGKLSRTGK